MTRLLSSLSIAAALGAAAVSGLRNGIDLPILGYSTWNALGCNIDADGILEVARAIKAEGLLERYPYYDIDDCYASDRRDASGNLQVNSTRFPSGMKPVVDELHGMGFKVGIYSSAGLYTCAGYPGSLYHEDQDAKWFAEQGFDLLKYDNCFNDGQGGTQQVSRDRYVRMRDALNATGRQIAYLGCQWGEDQVYMWGPTTFNSWRISGDISTSFDGEDDRCPCTSSIDCRLAGYHCSIYNIVQKAAPLLQKTASPEPSFGDLDSLQIDNGDSLSRDESITHFSIWALVKSPLIIGNDVRKMTNLGRAILRNDDVIAVNQDRARKNAQRNWKQGLHELWTVQVQDGYVAAFVNFDSQPWTMTANMTDTFRNFGDADPTLPYDVYDLWANVDFEDPSKSKPAAPLAGGPFTNTIPEATIAPHGTLLVKFVASNATAPVQQQRTVEVADEGEGMLVRGLDRSMGIRGRYIAGARN